MAGVSFMMLHRHRFVKTIERALHDPCRLQPGDRLILAVSGGADSVALLRALAALADRPHWQLELHVAHVHHHLRGAEAEEDARFVADLAGSLGLPSHRRDVNPAADSQNAEAAARRLRYRALAEIAASAGADAIATAHHADDQLETLLMRLIRGSSVEGLAGIAPRRRLGPAVLIRPMLGADHTAAVAFLREIDQPWREDPTNRDTTRWRAKLRADVLPHLRELRPGAAQKAAETADRLRETGRWLRRAIRRAERRHLAHGPHGEPLLPRDPARRLPRPVLAGLIRRQSRALGAGGDALGNRILDPIVRAVRDSSGEPRRFELGGGVDVTVDAEAVRFRRRSDES